MKSLFTTMALVVVASADDRVKVYPLDENRVYRVETAPHCTTTVEFPATIEMINGKGLVADEAKQSGKFEFGFVPNTNFFSLTPIVEGAQTNINVAVDGRIYCLEFVVSQNPNYKVRFSEEAPAAVNYVDDGTGVLPPLSMTPYEADLAEKRQISVARMIGLIDKAKAFPLLAAQKDSPVKDILTGFPGKVFETPDVKVTLRGVYRDNAFDGICFALEMESKKKKILHYDVESFQVGAGGRWFGQFTASASGEVPAEGTSLAYFAIAGDGMGGRNDLAPTNEFEISLNFTEEKVPEPLLPEPLGSGKTKAPEPSSAKDAIKSSK